MRMRQSLAEIESAFVDEIEEDRERAQRLQRQAERRTHVRHIDKRHKRGSLRFGIVLLVIVATTVVVTIAMFQALYLVMG